MPRLEGRSTAELNNPPSDPKLSTQKRVPINEFFPGRGPFLLWRGTQ